MKRNNDNICINTGSTYLFFWTFFSAVYGRNITCPILQCSRRVHFNMTSGLGAGNIFEQTMMC